MSNSTQPQPHSNNNGEDISEKIKEIEESLGEIFSSINYLENPKLKMADQSRLPEEAEYDELDQSLEDLDNRITDKVADIPRINRDVLRLSLKLNGRPATPTRYTPSVYSEADSGLGSPEVKKNEWPRNSYQTLIHKNEDDSLFRSLARSSMRSNRSFHMDNGVGSPQMTPTRSFNLEPHWGRITPDLGAGDAVSIRSLTIPVGSTDGRKIISKKDTSPDVFLQPP